MRAACRAYARGRPAFLRSGGDEPSARAAGSPWLPSSVVAREEMAGAGDVMEGMRKRRRGRAGGQDGGVAVKMWVEGTPWPYPQSVALGSTIKVLRRRTLRHEGSSEAIRGVAEYCDAREERLCKLGCCYLIAGQSDSDFFL